MKALRDVINFLYQYYAIYFFVVPTLIISLIRAQRYAKKYRLSIERKAFLYPVIIIVSCILSYAIYRMPIFFDTITINCDADSKVVVENVTSLYRIYSHEEIFVGTENHVKLPVGKERSITLLSGPQYGSCEIRYGDESIHVSLNSNEIGTQVCEINSSYMADIGKEYTIKLLVIILLSILISIGICKLVNCDKIKCYKLSIDYGYGLLIFIVLFVQFILYRSDTIRTWVACWYATDYSMGVSSRFFIGTFLSLFYDDYLSEELAYKFCSVVIICLILCIAYMLNEIIRNTEECIRKSVTFLICCYICCPCSVAYLWTEMNYGRLEMYTLLLSLIGVIAFNRIENRFAKYLCVTFISVISCAIYQGYVFLFFPIILMTMICDIIKYSTIQTKNLILGIVNCVITGVAFLVFQFFSYVKFEDVDSMVKAIRNKSNVYISEKAIYYECFSTISEAYDNLNKVNLTTLFLREKTFITICLLAPLIIMFFAIYLKCFSLLREKRKNLFYEPYIFFLITYLAILPQFILNVDWERWMAAVTINIFFGIWYLSFKEYEEMQEAMVSLERFIEKHRFITIMVLVYLSVLDKFQDVAKLSDGLFNCVFEFFHMI